MFYFCAPGAFWPRLAAVSSVLDPPSPVAARVARAGFLNSIHMLEFEMFGPAHESRRVLPMQRETPGARSI